MEPTSFVGIPELLYAPGHDFADGQEVTYHFDVLDQQNVVVKYQLSNLDDSTTYIGSLLFGFIQDNGSRITWGLYSCQNVPSGQSCTTEVAFTPGNSKFNVNYLPIDTNSHTLRMNIDTHNQTSSLFLDETNQGLEVKIPQTKFTGFFLKMTIAPKHSNGLQEVWLGSESALQCAQVIPGTGQNCQALLHQFCTQAGPLTSICRHSPTPGPSPGPSPGPTPGPTPSPTPPPPSPPPSNDILLYVILGFGLLVIVAVVLFLVFRRKK